MSIELFHNFSLIHDDIEDKDEFRRNRETVWKIWGEEVGIISGNSMHALASKALDSVETNNDYKLIELRKLVNETCIEVIEGQYLDIDFEKRKEISLDDYLEMIEKKTGALIKTSVILGSILKDCEGICGGSASEDCSRVCEGSAVLDCSGVCDGYGTT